MQHHEHPKPDGMKLADSIVLSALGEPESALAIAACRAGARGFLDAEWEADGIGLAASIDHLQAHTAGRFGVKLLASNRELLNWLSAKRPAQWAWVWLCGDVASDGAEAVEQLADCGIDVLWEVTSPEGLAIADSLGVQGVILKGNEAGGRVGEWTSLVLLQHWRRYRDQSPASALPAWVQGGVGLHTAAACWVGGATGFVLDSQLLLARESRMKPSARAWIAGMDGGESRVVGGNLDDRYRLVARPATNVIEALATAEERLWQTRSEPAIQNPSTADLVNEWRAVVAQFRRDPENATCWLVGQDIAFAKPLADRFVTVAGILQGILGHAEHCVRVAAQWQPLSAGAPLATIHGTQYPILQGPMTRVSDTARFAHAVAEAGALPFLALAMMRADEVDRLLDATRRQLANQPWGVGLLGFLPAELRQEQTEVIRRYRPPFALIAGGRPDQARQLEVDGIATYLHVPSPGLLRMFLRDGARRFVFEGRECGGHVGPRTSFVLWETMCQILLEHLGPNAPGDELQVVFAGGIHDAVSAAMIAAMSAGLVERGVKIGVLMGTAYLFTAEAVATGGIVPRFQQSAQTSQETVLFETGPGHAIRCLRTPYFQEFQAEKRRLRQAGRRTEEIIKTLEYKNLGRLRVASKGVDRVTTGAANDRRLTEISADAQHERGMYMIGQVASLRGEITTMRQLHDEVCQASTQFVQARAETLPHPVAVPANPCDVAIVGMSCYYPGSVSLGQYWQNILNRHDAVTEIPDSHWDWRLYYDPDPQARDKIVSKWGGFLGDVPIDPMRYGITPKSMPCIEPLQLLLLESVRHALDDAGYTQRPFPRERTAAILGIGGGGSPLAVAYGFRSCLPMLDTVEGLPVSARELLDHCESTLPEWTEDSFPGFLMNVAVGRVANRFNLGGSNYAIDAACASSLAAVHACARELEMGTADVAIAMGADTVQTPYSYMAFSKTHALSPRGRCAPFDASADGIVLSEGIGAVILKRLSDALRDGDQIYAVIKGIGSSSDGKEKGLTAPNAAGQLRALRRAYEKAGLSPATVSLVEAHGTGTAVGDETEVRALTQVFQESGARPQSCALGSVKSMIGHSKCAAGIGGLIKTALALHHKVLPPTLVETPNPKADFAHSPLYLNTEPRPWVHGDDSPRRAGVSAFGFGGTNAHVVLQEFDGDYLGDRTPPAWTDWPAELYVWRRPSRAELRESLEKVRAALQAAVPLPLAELAASLWQSRSPDASHPTLAIVAANPQELKDRIDVAIELLMSAHETVSDPRGIYFAETPTAAAGGLAFLFPGQGAQYVDMLAPMAMNFAEVRETFDRATHALHELTDRPLGQYVYPPTPFSAEQEQADRRELARTEIAQPAIGMASMGLVHLLRRFGVTPQFLAGHSFGEYTALCAAGVLSEEALWRVSYQRGLALRDCAGAEPGGMAAVIADAETVLALIQDRTNLTLANRNAPDQVVVSGPLSDLKPLLQDCQQRGIRGQLLDVSCAFHSPWVQAAGLALADVLRAETFSPADTTVYSNTLAGPYPDQPNDMVDLLARHLASPVRFVEEIEALYAAGARIFLEVGPQAQLTGLVGKILADKPHVTVATDVRGRDGCVQWMHSLATLLTAGIDVHVEQLFADRVPAVRDLQQLLQGSAQPQLPATTWIVNGIRARPLKAAEPVLIGQRRAPSTAAAVTNSAVTSAAKLTASPTTASVTTASTTSTAPRTPISPNQHISSTRETTMNEPRPSLSHHAQNGHAAQSQPQPHPDPNPKKSLEPTLNLSGSECEAVMLGFQQVMAKFLDTQRDVMLEFLRGGDGTYVAADRAYQEPVSSSNAVPPHELGTRTVGTYGAIATPPQSARSSGHHGNLESSQDPSVKTEDVMVGAATTDGMAPIATSAPEAMMTIEQVTERLIDLVSQRTGYAKEILDVNLDLEADLGIDSIKRVEILGELAESLQGGSSNQAGALELEKLTSLRTLRSILQYLATHVLQPETAAQSSASDVATNHVASVNRHAPTPSMRAAADQQADTAPLPEMEPIQRGLVQIVDLPPLTSELWRVPQGTILITDDMRGIAQAIADRLADYGQHVCLLRMAAGGNSPERTADSTCHTVDLTEPAAVADVMSNIRSAHGPIGGLIHLLPLASWSHDTNWARRAEVDVKSLYLLAQNLEQDLCGSGDGSGAFLLAATGMGGALGYELEPQDVILPGHGGILGFLKCLGAEWPDVTVRAVDFNAQAAEEEIGERLLAELSDREGPLEVGYRGPRRTTWEPVRGALDMQPRDLPLLSPDSTVLITGGARGITAAIAKEIAQRYQCHLVLVGRSSLPEADEDADTAGCIQPADLKAALVRRCQQQGRTVAPAEIEAQFKRILQDREIRDNLREIAAAGARVEYHALDVRDESAIRGLLHDLQERVGGVDAVIHGAGVIEDKLVRDKTSDSFDRVFGTKVTSAYHLARYLDPQRLRFCVFFASIASRYGNRGQSDYAAANEVLSKLAVDLDRRWPGRVLSVAWGPWAGIGMVSHLEKHLAARGVALISPAEGTALLMDELEFGKKGESEVLLAGGAEHVVRPKRSRQVVLER